MHINDLRRLCEQEWADTRAIAVQQARDYMTDHPECDIEQAFAMGVSVFDCIDWQDAVAYIVASGCVFDALHGNIGFDDSPYQIMRREVIAELEGGR